MNIEYLSLFKKSYKKLNKLQQQELKNIVEHIINNPMIGQLKTGDLSGLRVYKKHVNTQLFLVGYTYCTQTHTCLFKSFGTHENFYRDLKKYLK